MPTPPRAAPARLITFIQHVSGVALNADAEALLIAASPLATLGVRDALVAAANPEPDTPAEATTPVNRPILTATHTVVQMADAGPDVEGAINVLLEITREFNMRETSGPRVLRALELLRRP